MRDRPDTQRDKLINRALKDFGTEHLPFKKFTANTAFYYLITISFFLFESFKYDMESDTVPATWYAGAIRSRKIALDLILACYGRS